MFVEMISNGNVHNLPLSTLKKTHKTQTTTTKKTTPKTLWCMVTFIKVIKLKNYLLSNLISFLQVTTRRLQFYI